MPKNIVTYEFLSLLCDLKSQFASVHLCHVHIGKEGKEVGTVL